MGLIRNNDRNTPASGQRSNAPSTPIRRIPAEFVSTVLSRTDVVEVVSSRVQGMKKKGSSYSACCPFHNEKSPSFTVNADRQTYHCFGCSAHGNALDFLMKHDGMGFLDALTELASAAHLEIPQNTDGTTKTAPSFSKAQEEACFDRTDVATKFFRHCLAYSDEAKAYLKERGISAETAKKYLIGYAPPDWQNLEEAFSTYGNDEILPLVGLVRVNDSGRRYDWFRHRIMFPVRDIRGRVVAFGGRKMPSDQSDMAKYINSPESPLFNKTKTLFGLFEAKEGIREHASAVVMEGYTDVIVTHQYGITNSVASMGTACTEEHIKRLKQLGAKTICFAFDGDAAGKNAAWRALRQCLSLIEEDVHFTFAFMPDGKDPDEVVKEIGSEAFFKLLDNAHQLVSYMLGELKIKHNNLLTSDDRANFLNDAESLIRVMPYRSRFRDMAKQQLSEMTGIRLVSVRQQSRVVPPSFRKARANTIWARLQKAAERAPNITVEYRDALLDMLNTADEDQQALIETINAAAPCEEEDDAIFAEDIKAADVLIEDHINKLRRAELQAKLMAGEIKGADYVEQLRELAA